MLRSLANKKILGIPARVGLLAVISVILIAGVATYVFLNSPVTPTGEADDVIKEEEIRIPEEAHEVRSLDGLAILSIPQSALPDGVDISDISITKLTESQVMLAVDGAEVIGYEMRPDGLEFIEEVFLTLTLDINSSVPLLLQTRQDDFRILNITNVGIDSENRLFVTASISHFSEIYSVVKSTHASYGISIEARRLIPYNVPIGDNVRASISISISNKTVDLIWTRNNNQVLLVVKFEDLKIPSILIEPVSFGRGLSIGPKLGVVKVPATTSLVNIGDTASVQSLTDFRCTNAGESTVWFSLQTTRKYSIDVHAKQGDRFLADPILTIPDRQAKLGFFKTIQFDCGVFPADFFQFEKISVPVDGSSIASTSVLEVGVTYKLRASGTFTIGGPGFADAEYAFGDGTIYDHCNNDPSDVDLGIDVGGGVSANFLIDKVEWGGYKTDHVYFADIIGAGVPITISYRDCNYPDNSPGDLSVEIFRAKEP